MEKISFAASVSREQSDGARPLINRLYTILRDLRDCQPAYGLKARHLTTLSAMVGFLKGQDHTMVFASNRTLQERLNNISLRSLQRALADLVESGMIERRSSPNGKRFAMRYHGNGDSIAFGFDLRPLLDRATEINHLADAYRLEGARAALLKQYLRRVITDIETALPHHSHLLEMRMALRRKLTPLQLEVLIAEAQALVPGKAPDGLVEIHIVEGTSTAAEMTCSDSQFGMHLHKSNKEVQDKEVEESQKGRQLTGKAAMSAPDELLESVLTGCPEVATYYAHPARSWFELREQAPILASWIGVPASLVQGLQRRFGSDLSAVAIFCLLQASPAIRKPGAYLASLLSGARSKEFDPMRWLHRLVASAPRRTAPALPS